MSDRSSFHRIFKYVLKMKRQTPFPLLLWRRGAKGAAGQLNDVCLYESCSSGVRKKHLLSTPQVFVLITSVACTSLGVPYLIAQNLLPNGSFELGDNSPTGWQASEGARVTTDAAHQGKRSVSGTAKRRGSVWESDPIALNSQTDYRLDGWIRSSDGEASLVLRLTDTAGKRVRNVSTALTQRAPDWQYVALEWNAAEAASSHGRL